MSKTDDKEQLPTEPGDVSTLIATLARIVGHAYDLGDKLGTGWDPTKALNKKRLKKSLIDIAVEIDIYWES